MPNPLQLVGDGREVWCPACRQARGCVHVAAELLELRRQLEVASRIVFLARHRPGMLGQALDEACRRPGGEKCPACGGTELCAGCRWFMEHTP